MENLTIREAAERLGVTTQAVNDLINRGILTVVEGTRPKRVTLSSLESWITRRDTKRAAILARVMRRAVKAGLVKP